MTGSRRAGLWGLSSPSLPLNSNVRALSFPSFVRIISLFISTTCFFLSLCLVLLSPLWPFSLLYVSCYTFFIVILTYKSVSAILIPSVYFFLFSLFRVLRVTQIIQGGLLYLLLATWCTSFGMGENLVLMYCLSSLPMQSRSDKLHFSFLSIYLLSTWSGCWIFQFAHSTTTATNFM